MASNFKESKQRFTHHFYLGKLYKNFWKTFMTWAISLNKGCREARGGDSDFEALGYRPCCLVFAVLFFLIRAPAGWEAGIRIFWGFSFAWTVPLSLQKRFWKEPGKVTSEAQSFMGILRRRRYFLTQRKKKVNFTLSVTELG